MPIPTGISGSRSAAILGLSKYATPFTVWQDLMEQRNGKGWNTKHGYIYEPFDGNAATQFGHALEDSVVSLTEQATGHTITHREAVYSDNDYTTCHIDGKMDNFTTLFEGKHCNFRVFGLDWGEPGTDRIPTAIQCQVQHNMLCTGLEKAHVSVLVLPKTVQDFEAEGWQAHYDNINGVHFLKNHETDQIVMPSEWAKVFAQIGNFHSYHIEAKPDTHKILRELYSEWWQRHIIESTPPEAVNIDDVKRLFVEPKGTLIVKEPMADFLREYKNCGKQLGKASINAKRRDHLKVQILKFAKEETTVMDDESQEKIVFRDEQGGKLGSWDGKTYRS